MEIKLQLIIEEQFKLVSTSRFVEEKELQQLVVREQLQ
jgi:hypothetical protein